MKNKSRKIIKENNITCKNCNNQFSGNYCNNCGQKSNIARLNLKIFIGGFFHAFTHLDKGFIYSAKELAIRPGHSIREYLFGKRSNHGNPFLMLLIVGGLCSYFYYHLDLRSINSVKINDIGGNLEVMASKYFTVVMFFYCLIYALFDYVFFRYKKYNYIEMFVLNTFMSVEVLFLNIILIPIWLIGRQFGVNDYIRLIVFFLLLVYILVVRYQFFEAENDKKTKKRLLLEFIPILGFLMAIGWKSLAQFFL